MSGNSGNDGARGRIEPDAAGLGRSREAFRAREIAPVVEHVVADFKETDAENIMVSGKIRPDTATEIKMTGVFRALCGYLDSDLLKRLR